MTTTKKLAPGDPRHGTRSAYTYYKCDCGACTAANRAYILQYMHDRPEQQENHRSRERLRQARLRKERNGQG